jgi:hypothetical protein
MRMFIGTVVQIIGAIILVSIILPYFLIAVAVIIVLYHWLGLFYRSGARDFKVCSLGLTSLFSDSHDIFSVSMQFFGLSCTDTLPKRFPAWRLFELTVPLNGSNKETPEGLILKIGGFHSAFMMSVCWTDSS